MAAADIRQWQSHTPQGSPVTPHSLSHADLSSDSLYICNNNVPPIAEKIFEDYASGKGDRPGRAEALSYARRGDTLVTWKLDRLGRSMAQPTETVCRLEAEGLGFRSLTEGVNTITPGGTPVFHIFGALAQFERDLFRERANAGLKAAEARGRKGGRKPVVTTEKLARARAHFAAGLTGREAAARLKVSKTALYVAANRAAGGTGQ